MPDEYLRIDTKLLEILQESQGITKEAKAMTKRESIILKLQSIDPNGIWTDEDNIAEGYLPLTLVEAEEALQEILDRN